MQTKPSEERARGATITPRGIGLVLGPALALGLQLIAPPESLGREGWIVASTAILMAVWWATEAVPIAVTALAPLVVFPFTGVSDTTTVGASYGNHIVTLLLGGFFIALALERWNLHTRIALNIVVRAGGRPRQLIFGFMIAAALLSMWISNTATTLMLMPIALSVARAEVGEEGLSGPFTLALILGVAYAASIGGVATPVGTPTNLIALQFLSDMADVDVSFPQWMALGLPAVIIMVPIVWLVLTRIVFPVRREMAHAGASEVREALIRLGKITVPETRVALIFGVVALAWIVRKPVFDAIVAAQAIDSAAYAFWDRMNSARADAAIAIAGAMATFIIPAGGPQGAGERIMAWSSAKNLPWDVVLLFGGGLALAAAMGRTGLTDWLGYQLQDVAGLPPIFLVMAFVAAIIFLTELTSNVATVTAFTPVLVTIALEGGANPLAIVAPAAIAGSFAFMLPVATAPNAIVYATGHVRMAQMMRAGLMLNLLAIPLLTALGHVLAPHIA